MRLLLQSSPSSRDDDSDLDYLLALHLSKTESEGENKSDGVEPKYAFNFFRNSSIMEII